jgi:hypothetical protein
MASCPFCGERYEDYQVVGVLPASEHLTHWLEDPIPVAQLFCRSCGRYTYMHPDHPDVLRLRKGEPYEQTEENLRTLNVAVEEIGDPELREQFARGRE